MDLDTLTASAVSRTGGTLLLNNGRCIIVQSIHHVSKTCLFFSLAGSGHTKVIGHDEIQAWEATAPTSDHWAR